MAINQRQIKYNIYQNKNSKSQNFKKYYARVEVGTALSMRGFIEHMVAHNGLYSRDVVTGVVIATVRCLKELIMEGQPVKLDGLGIFYPVISSKHVDSREDFNAARDITALRIRFNADQSQLDNLTGKQNLTKASFVAGNFVEVTKVTTGDKTKTTHVYTPLAERTTNSTSDSGSGSDSDSGSGSDVMPNP